MTDRGLQPGDVAAMLLPDDAYGLCQVTGVGDGRVSVCGLRWHSVDPPVLQDLDDVEPLRLDFYGFNGRIEHVSIDASSPIPPGFRWLGSRPVPDGVPVSADTFTTWRSLIQGIDRQRRWDHDLSMSVKDAYRAAATHGDVRVDFGAGPVTIGSVVTRLDFTAATLVPASGSVLWSALDRLPGCSSLIWSGPDRGLAAALAAHPIISSLIWQDAPPVVDLTDSSLLDLTIEGQNLRELRLPTGQRSLELVAPTRHLTVQAVDAGRRISLDMSRPAADTVVPAGLSGVRECALDGDGTLSGACVEILKDLQELRIYWRKPPGELIDADRLSGLSRLATVELFDAYGLAADSLPDLPSLTHLGIHGLRRSIVPELKTRYRDTNVRLIIRRAKADAWLAANMTNPFRDWVDDDARGGTAASKAYAAAVRAITKLPVEQPDRIVATEKTLRILVDTLNGIDDRYDLIDTLRREEAVDAFLDLAAQAGVSSTVADRWIDEWREF